MRRLMIFTIGFAVACLMGSAMSLPLAVMGGIACGLVIIFLILWTKYTQARIGITLFLGVAIGFFSFYFFDSNYLHIAKFVDGTEQTVAIETTDYSYQTEYGSAVEGTVTLNDRVFRVKAYLKTFDPVEPGERLTGNFRLRFTAGGKEAVTYHRTDGIYLLAYQSGKVTVIQTENENILQLAARWKYALLEKIEQLLPDDAAPFAKALLLGERSELDYITNTAFKISGISHVVAVSGLHVTILFSMIYTVAGKRRLLTCLLGIPSVILFAAMVGFTPSITRACIMQVVMMIALLTNREYDPPTALSFAVLTMLAINPMTILSISFQLSVGCMIGIFMFSTKIQNWLKDEKRIGSVKGKTIPAKLKRWVVSSVSVTLSAIVFTTPLVAYYFGCISLVGVLTNLLTLWVITFIFYGIFLVCGIGFLFSAAGSMLGTLIAFPIRYVLGISQILASIPMAAVYTKSVYIVIWLIGCYVLFTAFMMMKEKPVKVFVASVLIGLCAAVGLSWAEPMMDNCRAAVMDVGQGQSILLQSNGRVFLVDCGGDDSSDAADVVAETLLSMGIYRLDGIIVTHYDADHAGGVPFLLSRVKTDMLILPDITDAQGMGLLIEQAAGLPAQYISETVSMNFDDTLITIAGPVFEEASNESSLCILFQAVNCDILISGDRGTLGEGILMKQLALPELELLIVGHHGSAYSTSEKLLALTTPENAIISVGADNSYGHPAESTLKRLYDIGCNVYRTDLNGTIVYRG